MSWHLQCWTPFRAGKWSDIAQVKAKEVQKVKYWERWFLPLQLSELHSIWYSDQLREMGVICQKEGWQRRNLCNNEKPPQPTQRGAFPPFTKFTLQSMWKGLLLFWYSQMYFPQQIMFLKSIFNTKKIEKIKASDPLRVTLRFLAKGGHLLPPPPE